MGLTLVIEKTLELKGIIDYYYKNQNKWVKLFKKAFKATQDVYPESNRIYPDDVANILTILIKQEISLHRYLLSNKKERKQRIRAFADLIVDYNWEKVSREGKSLKIS